jgi:hypothetical protein
VRLLLVPVFVLLVLPLAGCLGVPGLAPSVRPWIRGFVRDRATNGGVAGARVTCQGFTVFSAADGAYEIFADKGPRRVIVTHPQYVELARSVDVRYGGPDVDFLLEARP